MSNFNFNDLVDYLNNNLLIAHYCGFDISKPLPSYWTFDRFDVLSGIMQSQVLYLSQLPIYEMTTTAEVHDSTVALDILADTHFFLPITECTFLADKGCDVKNICNRSSLKLINKLRMALI